MGIIRLLLALAVVIAHSSPVLGFRWTQLCGGLVAVQLFYIISGFYMAMVLTDRYTGPGALQRFYTSRLLRLFPAYWIACIAAVVVFAVLHATHNVLVPPFNWWTSHWTSVSWSSVGLLTFSNVFLVGQDWLMFAAVNPESGNLVRSMDLSGSMPAHKFLVIPQCWTVALELTFYAIAPFLVRRRTVELVVFTGILLTIRQLCIFELGFEMDPWTYRFFPFELPLFIFGVLSFRFMQVLTKSTVKSREVGSLVLISMAVCLFAWPYVPTSPSFGAIPPFYFIFALCIPVLFELTKNSKLDRYLGEMSYPIYLTHNFIAQGVIVFTGKNQLMYPIWTLAFTLLFSILLAAIQHHIDHFRHSRLLSHTPST